MATTTEQNKQLINNASSSKASLLSFNLQQKKDETSSLNSHSDIYRIERKNSNQSISLMHHHHHHHNPHHHHHPHHYPNTKNASKNYFNNNNFIYNNNSFSSMNSNSSNNIVSSYSRQFNPFESYATSNYRVNSIRPILVGSPMPNLAKIENSQDAETKKEYYSENSGQRAQKPTTISHFDNSKSTRINVKHTTPLYSSTSKLDNLNSIEENIVRQKSQREPIYSHQHKITSRQTCSPSIVSSSTANLAFNRFNHQNEFLKNNRDFVHNIYKAYNNHGGKKVDYLPNLNKPKACIKVYDDFKSTSLTSISILKKKRIPMVENCGGENLASSSSSSFSSGSTINSVENNFNAAYLKYAQRRFESNKKLIENLNKEFRSNKVHQEQKRITTPSREEVGDDLSDKFAAEMGLENLSMSSLASKKRVSFHEHVIETDVESGSSRLLPIINSKKQSYV